MAFAATDEALMQAFQRGSREAFEELFERYRSPIYGFFRRRLAGDRASVVTRSEDLTQETFLAVIHAVQRYEPRATVRTYLYGIAFNLILAERRRRARTPGADDGTDCEPESAPHSVNTLWVRQALERLDDMDREILMLREFEELSYIEIGEVLNVPLNTVRSRLFRARVALKAQLLPQETPHAN